MWVHDQASRLHAAEQRGLAEGRRASARNALDLGLSVAEAAKVSGLSRAEVAELDGRSE
jgi:predicted transposase YdaD